MNIESAVKNQEASAEGSIVAIINDQPKLAVMKSKLLEKAAVKGAFIFTTAKSNSKVEVKSDKEGEANDDIIGVKQGEANKLKSILLSFKTSSTYRWVDMSWNYFKGNFNFAFYVNLVLVVFT